MGKRRRFYLAALELGEAPVQKVAEKAGITHTPALRPPRALVRKGLVSRVEKERRPAPEGAVFTMTTWTYDDKVSIIASRREDFGMIVESEDFAEIKSVSPGGSVASRSTFASAIR